MEELSTLATGFEVDGGQLRYHLYIWLEQEVEALRELCNYGIQRRGNIIFLFNFTFSFLIVLTRRNFFVKF